MAWQYCRSCGEGELNYPTMEEKILQVWSCRRCDSVNDLEGFAPHDTLLELWEEIKELKEKVNV